VELPAFTGPVALDFETSGLDYWVDDFQVLGVAAYAPGIDPFYVDFRSNPRAQDWVRDIMPNIDLVNHHVKFDWHIAMLMGCELPKSFYCTMTAEALIDEHRLSYSLDSVAFDRLGERKVDIGPKTNLADLPLDQLEAYAATDAWLAFRVFEDQKADIVEQELGRVLALEMDLLPILAEMEHFGVRVDIERAHAAIPALTDAIENLQMTINSAVGRQFNVNSTPQIRALFQPESVSKFQYRLVDGTLCGTTKSGGPSIDQHVLKEMTHPVAAMIRRLRKLIKTRDTFIMGHVLGHADSRGYVHTTFNQTKTDNENGTGSGRLSSTGPALQQINARDPDTAEIVRSLFLPDPGTDWICCDYSQVDFRMCAHLIRDDRIYDMYDSDPDTDFHQMVSDMTGIPRNPPYAGAPNTKTINLSLAFGAGAGKTAKTMGMAHEYSEWRGRLVIQPGAEARAIFDEYHSRFPKIKEFMKRAENVGKSRGYVKTAIGRRIRFEHGVGAHKAAGLLYQSYAADAHKIGLIKAYRAAKEAGARMMLSVHDEINLSGFESHVPAIKAAYVDVCDDLGLRVPIRSSAGVGANWREASKK